MAVVWCSPTPVSPSVPGGDRTLFFIPLACLTFVWTSVSSDALLKFSAPPSGAAEAGAIALAASRASAFAFLPFRNWSFGGFGSPSESAKSATGSMWMLKTSLSGFMNTDFR
eukprot:scaffold1645_cov288-Pavlova_lutheri.AAC.4